MTNPPEAIERLQNGLEPYIKPREQVNYIRRVLALHLGYSSHDGPIRHPLSLVDSWQDAGSIADVKGLQREYIEALNANIAARRQFDEVLHVDNVESPSTPEPRTNGFELLEERVALLKLQKKKDRLLAVQRHLDVLRQEPASTPDFLNVEQIFNETAVFPSVPKEVVNSLVAEQSSSQPDIRGRAQQLEKRVLRARLLLKQEEKLLHDARARSKEKPDIVSNSARLEALNTTRNELINWIETELSNASAEDACEEVEDVAHGNERLQDDQATVTALLQEIKDKYARYLTSRKALLAVVAQRPQPALPPTLQPQTTTRADASISDPINHLLTPYVEALLSVARGQKAAITQKSHMKSALNKQTKDAGQTLGHLAEESQLLPTHPMKESLRRRSGLWNELTTRSSEGPDLSNRIKPWVFAADSAKIATLESVAETVESGQVALENSMRAVRDIDRILGQGRQEETEESALAEPTEEDVWLGTGAKAVSARKHSEKEKSSVEKKDIWSNLHGNLGLIGHED